MSNAKYNSSLPTYTSGSLVDLQTDANGKLLVASTLSLGSEVEISNDTGNPIPVNPGALTKVDDAVTAYTRFDQPATTTATWTGATSLNTRFSASTVGFGLVRLTAIVTGSPTGGVLTFEGNDGTNYFTIAGKETNSFVLDSTYNLSGGTMAWEFNVAGWQTFDVKLSTVLSGGSSPQVVFIMQTLPAVRDVTSDVGIHDGTNLANVLKGDGTAAGQSSLLTAGTYLEKAALSTASTTNNDLQASFDVGNYRYYALQLLGTWTGTVQVQGSNDNVTFVTLGDNQGINLPSGPSQSMTANGQYEGSIRFRYMRVRVTTGGTGTVQGVLEVFATAPPRFLNQLAAVGNLSNNAAAPSSSLLGAMPALANAAAPTITEGRLTLASVDLSGNQRTLITGGLMPTNTALNTYSAHITTNTTTTPTSSTAYISLIVISVPSTGTTSTVTIKDKQGTPLTLISAFSTASALTGGDAIYSYVTPTKMVSGIDIVTAGAAAATVDVWINYFQ